MKKNLKKIILLGFLLIFLLILFYYNFFEYLYTLKFLQKTVNKNPISTRAQDIKAFKQINFEFSQREIPIRTINNYYDLLGPKELLNIVNEDFRCHMKGHNIGRVIYQRNKNIEQSMQICSSSCTFGCLHGVLFEIFESRMKSKGITLTDHIDIEQVKIVMNDICNDAKKSSGVNGYGSCVHGLGHALIGLTNDSIALALPYCDNFKEPKWIFYCSTGLYMQYFIDKKEDEISQPFNYPCGNFSFPAACYRYKIDSIFKQTDYQEAIKECLGIVDKNEQHGCFNGIGFAFSQSVQKNQIDLETLCKNGDETDKRLCIEGAIEVITTFDRDKSIDICKKLSSDSRTICQNAVGNNWEKKNQLDYYVRK